ncbi:hypothetical protein BJ912DRAFT_929448 [Pholiota molesta]|nr:hypothetical protein BJ912DRAFT_929448 [Pholiota molesta]
MPGFLVFLVFLAGSSTAGEALEKCRDRVLGAGARLKYATMPPEATRHTLLFSRLATKYLNHAMGIMPHEFDAARGGWEPRLFPRIRTSYQKTSYSFTCCIGTFRRVPMSRDLKFKFIELSDSNMRPKAKLKGLAAQLRLSPAPNQIMRFGLHNMSTSRSLSQTSCILYAFQSSSPVKRFWILPFDIIGIGMVWEIEYLIRRSLVVNSLLWNKLLLVYMPLAELGPVYQQSAASPQRSGAHVCINPYTNISSLGTFANGR